MLPEADGTGSSAMYDWPGNVAPELETMRLRTAGGADGRCRSFTDGRAPSGDAAEDSTGVQPEPAGHGRPCSGFGKTCTTD